MVGTIATGASTDIWWDYYDIWRPILKGLNFEPSYLWLEPGIYRPVIIPGATILRDSLKDKIKAKYIRAGPRKQQ